MLISPTNLRAQCANDLEGIYAVRFCDTPDSLSSYLYSVIITSINDSTLIIDNFVDIPDGIICGSAESDTLVITIDCDDLSINSFSTSVCISGFGTKSWSGDGQVYGDSLMLDMLSTCPNGNPESCRIFNSLIILGSNTIDNKDALTEISIVNGSLNIISQRAIVEVFIYDLGGNIVLNSAYLNQEYFVGNLSSGIYMVLVRFNDSTTTTQKIVITNK